MLLECSPELYCRSVCYAKIRKFVTELCFPLTRDFCVAKLVALCYNKRLATYLHRIQFSMSSRMKAVAKTPVLTRTTPLSVLTSHSKGADTGSGKLS